jgi:hypothetical protein
MKELINSSLYDALLTDEYNRMRGQGILNPLSYGAFSLQEELGKLPLWAVEFNKKISELDANKMFKTITTERNLLRPIKLPDNYNTFSIEREIVTTPDLGDALIERLSLFSAIPNLLPLEYISTLVKRQIIGLNEDRKRFNLTTQMKNVPDMFFTTQIEIQSLKDLLCTQSPILLLGMSRKEVNGFT